MYSRLPSSRMAASVVFDAFLDTFSGAGLFGKLRWPGAPTEFIDSRTVDEYLDSGEFDETIHIYRHSIESWRRDRAASEAARSAASVDRNTRAYEEHAVNG